MSKNLIATIAPLLMLLSRIAYASPEPCPGETTSENEQCLKSKLDDVESRLTRYTEAAIKRIEQGDDPEKASASFRISQVTWSKYREAECDSVYDYYSSGTIRGIMSLVCSRRLAESRTYEIWYNWLTYMDSTPPILPEPVLDLGR